MKSDLFGKYWEYIIIIIAEVLGRKPMEVTSDFLYKLLKENKTTYDDIKIISVHKLKALSVRGIESMRKDFDQVK